MASRAPRNGSQPPPQQDPVTRFHNNALLTPTTLMGRLDVPSSTAHADSSSSESDFQPPKQSGFRPTHARSMSNPFPSLFSGRKSGQDSAGRGPPEPDLDRHEGAMAGPSVRKHRRGAPAGSKDFATGNCMTCASLVKWPKELRVFKCTICTTINDLVPVDNGGRGNGASGQRRDAPPGSPASHHRGQPISTQHSKRLVRQCLHSYIARKLCSGSRSNSETGPDSPSYGNRLRPAGAARGHERAHERAVREQGGRQADNGQSTYEPKYVFDEEPSLRPNPLHLSSAMSRSYSSSYHGRPSLGPPSSEAPPSATRRDPSTSHDDGPKRVFKPLEDYIVACLTSFDCVNSSFTTQPPRQPGRPGEVPIRRRPVPSREPQGARQPTEAPREALPMDDIVSGLDPKILLLGDFAENGMWWTGRQDSVARTATTTSTRTEHTSKASISSKSPQVNWSELTDWYSAITNVAEGWFGVYEQVSQDPCFVSPTEKDLQALERDLLQAQAHVQRVLLKATELLLKRPGRPISEPADLRFLLIILENPLLHSDAQQFRGIVQPEIGLFSKVSPPQRSSLPRSGLLSGHHSGIIKRILGLISNSSTECHNQLTNWLAKYHTAPFIRVKDLVSGFLTYRMLRQGDKTQQTHVDITAGLIPEMQAGRSAGAYLHDEIGSGSSKKKKKEPERKIAYAEDWQIMAASRVLALLFAANNLSNMRHGDEALPNSSEAHVVTVRDGVRASGQLLPTSDFYNLMVDNADLVGDFESWESKRAKFSFCQYPFLLSIWAKTKILEYDARRQMQNKARDAFFDSIMTRRNIRQYLTLDVRRDCLVDDSLQAVSEVIGSGSEDVKKALRITFRGEEGIDAGGLRKEWFLLLVREVFNPEHGMFLYDEDSQYCYFNPNSFETSDQFFLVGVVMGLAIYNSTILDVALPPFTFRKLLASAPAHGQGVSAHPRPVMKYTLEDLAEYRPRLARGLRQLLDYDGDVEPTFCLDFVIDTDRYGTAVQVPLCQGGERKPVTNSNRREYADLYVRYLLESAVTRQFEPFKRGFYTVCGGNAFSLFRPEEIELLVRGSDEALDIAALRGVAEYDGWGSRQPDGKEPLVSWFWESFQEATPAEQRRMLLFITGSDRIPAMGASMLSIKISCLGEDSGRYPIARTCFNLLSLWRYESKERLENMLWRAVHESEGFGLK
ncbi:E3 ubiquitin-protein ligase [Tolypocladium capitatum]|uniref:HECT-type E3 ubiquitin transferase n=1 Tax=Tolypocladium capitatum TaxID=45235 RepID=A0A2K3QLU3_9HYPO|nr:E3 ubiquitin-protein ligase [Tolypocladium capitatum]